MSDLVRLSHGLWRPAESVGTLRDRCACVLDALPPGAVLCGRTAAELHGLWIPGTKGASIEVVLTRPTELPRAFAHSRRREVLTRRRTLRRTDVCVVDGLPVTTEERTWVDLAPVLSLENLVACGDSVLRGSATFDTLAATVDAAHRQRGVVRARQALPLLDERSRSRPESLLRVTVVISGLPAPEVNRPIYSEQGEWLAEPDLHYAVPRLALEYQGADHADVSRVRRDVTRTLDVLGAEWLSIPFGPAEVFGRPWTIGPYVRAHIERRAPGWLRRVARKAASGAT